MTSNYVYANYRVELTPEDAAVLAILADRLGVTVDSAVSSILAENMRAARYLNEAQTAYQRDVSRRDIQDWAAAAFERRAD